MGDQKNLMIAILLSVAILFGYQYFFEIPRLEHEQARQQSQQSEQARQGGGTGDPSGQQEAIPSGPAAGIQAPALAPAPGAARAAALAKSVRVPVENARVKGSISLTGGRFDDLVLSDYKQTLDKASGPVTLLRPAGTPDAYFVNVGWALPNNKAGTVNLPSDSTVWRADVDALRPGRPLVLTWDNGQGLTFRRTYKIDTDYVLTVRQRVDNNGAEPVDLYPFGLITRTGTPDTIGLYILHEGPLGVFDDVLSEFDYDDLQEKPETVTSTGGWLGITDKYWLAALIPDPAAKYDGHFRHQLKDGQDRYYVDYVRGLETIPAGGTAEVFNRIFVGAKEVNLLDGYSASLNIARFDLAVDFGWFYFLTKPFFHVLDYFNTQIGNFGIAILVLTVCVKLIFYPLANKSYQAMSKMKKLQPEMIRLRERFGEDKQKMNQELMALYKKEKVNPASGCLPILLQIPVFFALYKVLFVTIEMRHAPFYGWVRDLSAPDPTNIFDLFGLIPWDPPSFMLLGIWPILMGISMYGQQLLNPQPADPVQAKIFLFMPLFFTFLLASFPAGLVIYWTWNNVLSMAQQFVIMKRMGVPIGRQQKSA